MTRKPILLFLHGVGDGDPDDQWMNVLNTALSSAGYDHLDAARVIAPKYARALENWAFKVPLPEVTVRQPSKEAARANRRDFERRIGAVEFRLGRHNAGAGIFGLDAAVGVALDLKPFRQAQRYLGDPQIRAQVLRHIIDALPTSGPIVIVGHSLGSVIAADLLRRLPVGLEVVGMVTIGSPLANNKFDVDKLREGMQEPPTNIAWWINFWNTGDPVAAHRGVSSVFPWLVDFRINTKDVYGRPAHAAEAYLGSSSVAAAIGFALFGSRSTELATTEHGIDLPLDGADSSLCSLSVTRTSRKRT